MDVQLGDNQIKQFSLALSINDVLNYINNNYDDYLNFLKEEIKNNNISKEEYDKELLLIDKIQKMKEIKI